MALTDKAIKSEKATDERREFADGSDGLYLIVQPSGVKSWAVRYRFNGKLKKLTLGRYPAIPLGVARTEAKKITVAVSGGHDPAAKPEVAQSDTVRACAERFLKDCERRNRSWQEVQRQFEINILPLIGAKPVHVVSGDDILKITGAVMDAGKAIMANRIHATLRRFFKWAIESRIIKESPCNGLKMPSEERSRDRVLSWDEVAALWDATSRTGQPYGPLVRLLLLSGQRRDEVTGLRDGELDKQRTTWIIPAERAKNGKEHEVPLTRAMLAELDSVKRIAGSKWLFTTNGETRFNSYSKSKARLDTQVGFAESWRLHDIRRTVATGLAELRTPVHVIESILNHKSGQVSGIAAVYNRHDYYEEKAQALVAWNRFLELICEDATRSGYELLKAAVRQRESADHERAARLMREFLNAINGSEKDWRKAARKARRMGAAVYV